MSSQLPMGSPTRAADPTATSLARQPAVPHLVAPRAGAPSMAQHEPGVDVVLLSADPPESLIATHGGFFAESRRVGVAVLAV
jgi:hypothetical protein